jgi:hypothetical protein
MADDTRLAHTNDPAELVKLARERRMTDEQIVRGLAAGSTSYAKLRAIAAIYAPILGITEAQFVRVARVRGSLS